MINTTNEGSKLYLYSITSVAILGGLLFGYDTAVISGAEKGLEAFFLSASDFQYNKVMHGITSSSALIGCVLGGAFSGIFASRLGRRNSTDLEDIFIAHIAGMDAMARALESAAALLNESPYKKMLADRYASFDGGKGKEFEDGKLTLEDVVAYAKANGEPKQTSGKQELYEAILNMYC